MTTNICPLCHRVHGRNEWMRYQIWPHHGLPIKSGKDKMRAARKTTWVEEATDDSDESRAKETK